MNLAEIQPPSLSLPTRIGVERWGTLHGGDPVRLFVLRNAHGMRVSISDLGATLVSWHAPDRAGRVADILLGHDTPAGYQAGRAFMGGTIGRCANRIAHAAFTLDGLTYSLDRNDGDHSLHGGTAGFHQVIWNANETDGALVLTHESPEGDGGFPGALTATVRYTLDDDGTLGIDYDAVCTAPTPVNLTNHAYFNLAGDASAEPADIRGHMIGIEGDEFFDVDPQLIPVLRRDVAGNAFDFRTAAPIGARLDWPNTQLAHAGGFDHCYVLRGRPGSVRPAATLYDPVSGRELSVSTSAAGMQFYTGNLLDGVIGRNGQRYGKYAGLCLETGAFPNQINMPEAAGIVLRPGQQYRHATRYRLSVR